MLEEKGIGRPSTYAPIISTIQGRGYVGKKDGKFFPEEMGMVVNDVLIEHFPRLFDIDFTARMEEHLAACPRCRASCGSWATHPAPFNSF